MNNCTPLKGDWKDRISKILVKYSMPTRQIAINEIIREIEKDQLSLLQQDRQRIVEALEKEKMEQTKEEANSDWFYGYGFNHAIDKAQEIVKKV